MAIQFVNDRSIEVGQRVKVYYNIHKGLFSIQDRKTGLVLAHAEAVQLRNVTAKVTETGRQRVLAQKKKNVHAVMLGEYVAAAAGTETAKAFYNPYTMSHFTTETGEIFEGASTVTCIDKIVKYAI